MKWEVGVGSREEFPWLGLAGAPDGVTGVAVCGSG